MVVAANDSPAVDRASRSWRWLAGWAALVVVLSGSVVLAQADATDEDDEANPYRPGIVAHYAGADAREHARVEDSISFHWRDGSPDARVAPGPFTARLRGNLLTRSKGAYRLWVYSAGNVRLDLEGQKLIEATSAEPAWHEASAVELEFGYHPLEVTYRRGDEPARLALFWQGPNFGFEPVGPQWLFHETASTPPTAFAEGRQLVRALRCGACHELETDPKRLAAPALDALAGNLSREWLIDWLSVPPAKTPGVTRRMPHFGFSRDEATAVAEYVWQTAKPIEDRPQPMAVAEAATPESKKKKSKKPIEAPPPPSAMAGATLFHSLGCLACHRQGELGNDGLFGGGDLSRVADKRPADFFARWLTDPAASNRHHRMPVFTLSNDELTSLSLYLQTLKSDSPPADGPAKADVQLGKSLVASAGCAQCHALSNEAKATAAPKRAKPDLAALARETGTCLDEPDTATRRPGYRLGSRERAAVREYLTQSAGVPSSGPNGEQLLTERSCLMCHARGHSAGLGTHLPAIAEAEPALRDVLPALSPPALFGIGDKLRDEALAAAIDRSQAPRRPWLKVRMPKFPLEPAELAALTQSLIDADRVPPRPQAAPPATSGEGEAATLAAGARLVTAEGFGCTSCHAIGKWEPQKVALNAHGSSLSSLGTRVRREWFDRWVRNPARIVPQMEMPSVTQGVRGVLEGSVDRQLAAVWTVLDTPSFTPPNPAALRVVRRANLPELSEPAAVLTEIIEVQGKPLIKPLVIGLANRHNVLFDLATARLAAWWIGDAARQQTRGKSWYWEAGAAQLLPFDKQHFTEQPCDIHVTTATGASCGAPAGQYVTEFDWFEHVAGGIRFAYRLHFPPSSNEPPIHVVQEFVATHADGSPRTGFVRRISLSGLPKDATLKIDALPPGGKIAGDQRSARWSIGSGAIDLMVTTDSTRIVADKAATVIEPVGKLDTSFKVELTYLSDAKVDQFPPLARPDRRVTQQTLNVVPGFEATRLPVTDEVMPTGLAWRPDGTLVVCSLEGRVWLGRDTNADGIEDQLQPFSDELAAPYGVAAHDAHSIDVINKYALLRLTDADGDGHAERTELLASGWGHTRDYHDWAVGLPRDATGNYYVSFPCQQDERTDTGAVLRGSVVRLARREPSSDDPRRFQIEPLAAGLRFPQGIARSAGGELFVTDNQGNYTPFNELNHVVSGARYGFINRLENKPGFDPPFRTAAVEIPHPWTRSVNGICFLEPPAGAAADAAPFGPFTGHLIGCEYDTRRLVRMSLETVAGEFQGAVYPFSSEPAAGEETFEGPLVCQVAPDGDVYIGSIRDSGWGAGANTGSLVRLRWRGDLPPGIAEIRAAREGFVIQFTAPVDSALAGQPRNYAVSSYRRIATPAYGGADQDRRVETINSITLSDDARRVTLDIDNLRAGFVYEFHLRNLTSASTFFPAEAYYTLRHRVGD